MTDEDLATRTYMAGERVQADRMGRRYWFTVTENYLKTVVGVHAPGAMPVTIKKADIERVELAKPVLAEGDRVEAVRFALDEGHRLWPVADDDGAPTGRWRAVHVAGQRDEDVTEVAITDGLATIQRVYPEFDWVYGINDNETVPPGTLGTVEGVNRLQVWIAWDNGRRLALTERDTVRVI